MTDNEIAAELENLILEANGLMQRQFEEKQILLKRIIKACDQPEKIISQKEILNDLEQKIEGKPTEFMKATKLSYLNSLIQELDQKEELKSRLERELSQVEANIKARDELIDILKEYSDLDEAYIHRLVMQYSEAQDELQLIREQIATFEILTKQDPRFKVLQLLKQYEGGISVLQLTYLLNTTQFMAKKIIQELIDLNLITIQNSLIKVTENISDMIPPEFITVDQNID